MLEALDLVRRRRDGRFAREIAVEGQRALVDAAGHLRELLEVFFVAGKEVEHSASEKSRNAIAVLYTAFMQPLHRHIGKLDSERAAAAGLALHLDGGAVQVRQVLDDRQAQAGARPQLRARA